MNVFCIEVSPRRSGAAEESLAIRLRAAGLQDVRQVAITRLFMIEGGVSSADAERIAREILADPVSEQFNLRSATFAPSPGTSTFEVFPRPGVMDPVAETT